MSHLLKVLQGQGETLQGCKVSPCSRKGFTLIELLVVIAILGILSAGILTAINVTSNLDKAKLAKAKTFSKSLENSLSVSQVGKWSFEESSAPFKDTSGNGNDGQCLGTSCPTSQDESICGLGFGRCLEFDGVDDYIDTGYNFGNNFDNGVTWCAWVNSDAAAAERYYINARIAGDPQGFSLRQTSGPGFSFIWSTSDGQADLDTSGVNPSLMQANKWFYLCGTWDTAQVSIYVNGDKIRSSALGGNTSTPLSNIWIGARTDLNGFADGKIDEVAIYNQALTAYQIQHLYAQGLPRHQLAQSKF